MSTSEALPGLRARLTDRAAAIPDRRRLPLWFLLCAVFAAPVGAFAGQAVQQSWGRWAAAGYLAAAVVAAAWNHPASHRAATGVALMGAVVAPLGWLVTGGRGMSRVGMGALVVVNRAGDLLLTTGTPYLRADQLTGSESLNPYGPTLAVFGLPHALGLTGWPGNPRLWFGVSAAVLIWVAFRRLGVPDPAVVTAAAFACPLLALPFVLGGTDLPILGLILLTFALLTGSGRSRDAGGPGGSGGPGRTGRPGWAGMALGLACAMKATAWPAALVLLPMLLVRDGRRAAWRFTVAGTATAVVSFAATVPAAFSGSLADLLRNTVLFPLRFTEQKTTAASPLPGHLIAQSGSYGNTMMAVLLIVIVLAAAVHVVRRPPRDLSAAGWQLATVYTVLFTLAPASRFGYFGYPLTVLGWLALTRHVERTAPAATRPPAPRAATSTMVRTSGP